MMYGSTICWVEIGDMKATKAMARLVLEGFHIYGLMVQAMSQLLELRRERSISFRPR